MTRRRLVIELSPGGVIVVAVFLVLFWGLVAWLVFW